VRARRTDANHGSIADAFERLGCRVHRTNGDWDLTVQHGGVTMLVEVKNPDTSYGKRGESARQKELPVMRRLVRNLDDVSETVNTLRRWHAAITRDGRE